MKRDLASEAAFLAFEAEVLRLLRESRPDPGEPKRLLRQAEKECDNIMAAIRAGILTQSTEEALEKAEIAIQSAKRRLEETHADQPALLIPILREIWKRNVEKLEQIDDVPAAREAIKYLVGEEIRLIPSDGILVAEILTGGPRAACQIMMVAGAGFEPTTFGL